ncbi:helix-turn-helix domain-containing protein [Longispora albida]|uniref:helix-turn-helix domain-containing protein n=1 Tax=Longispora albida TaxID=203523 RepID=UPI00316AC0A9
MKSRDSEPSGARGSSLLSRITLYSPAEVAKALRCSEWWVKEQARKRRIPFTWLGGSYQFTEEHVVEIIRVFEKTPASMTPAPSAARRVPQQRKALPAGSALLVARVPRRAQRAGEPGS